MKPAVALHEPRSLDGETRALLSWHVPDLVAYQHSEDEWWFAPLDDNLPIVRLNRTGLEMLKSMNGHTTVGALLEKYGERVCGPDGEPGRWHLERWSLPTYSLCFYGTEPPGGHRHKAKWDVLLQQIREGWSGQDEFEGEEHLEDFHVHGLNDGGEDDGHFDLIETTVSHLFRESNETLNGLSYGRLLMQKLRRLGWFSPKPKVLVEIGGGLGYVARDLGKELLPFEKQGVKYLSVDITKPFLKRQLVRAAEGGWSCTGARANGEFLPFKDNSVDLVIDNENMADMTPVKLTRQELISGTGETAQHQEALDWIRRARLPIENDPPDEVIFNLGPFRFVAELWRVLKPGGKAFLTEFGIEEGWPAPVKLPGHTEYEVQYGHLRQAVRWLGFQEQYLTLPQFLSIKPDTKVLCTGAAYTIQRFCGAIHRPFTVRAYTERELKEALGEMFPRLQGLHYHDVADPAWFGLLDFKVLLLEKPGGMVKSAFTEQKGYRWYSQR
ncbi:MAG: methyltransferase domain-containing protein [Nitrospira sp.]|nr:methyltransferase domain-containing protein [Nitrospira sp.]